jgi:acetyltransferase
MRAADCAAFREREHRLADGRIVTVRPIRPDDEAALAAFYGTLSERTRHLRFQQFTGALNAALMRFYTHIDYDRHMAFVCEYQGAIVGDARYVANAGMRSCELGIVLADDWHHTGVAQLLMRALEDAARERGFERIEGLVLAENADMLGFVKELGFDAEQMTLEPTLVRVVKRL